MRARAPVTQRGGVLDCEGVVEGNHVPCRAIAEREEALYAEEVYASGSGMDGWRVRLVKLVDVVRRNGGEGSDEERKVGRTTGLLSL